MHQSTSSLTRQEQLQGIHTRQHAPLPLEASDIPDGLVAFCLIKLAQCTPCDAVLPPSPIEGNYRVCEPLVRAPRKLVVGTKHYSAGHAEKGGFVASEAVLLDDL